MQLPTWASVLLCTLTPLLANALSLDITSSASIKNASSTVAKDLLSYYHGTDPGQPTGLFGQPYPWWEAGAVWGSLIDYWNYTGDAQYVGLVQQALLSQVGPSNDYMTPNQTKTEANDDQAIWALATMRAAELQFPSPSASPSWLELAINVFNDQASRWDAGICGGGLRWQIFTFNKGYDYKDSISSGAFFQLAARLARYTGNQTYADWATKSYDWTSSAGFLSEDYKVFEGALVENNCNVIDRIQWTYAAGAFMYGSAVMTNLTNTTAIWKKRTNDLLSSMSIFFTGANDTHVTSSNPGIMTEVACEPLGTCNTDQYAYKGLTAQWMGEAMQVAPFTTDIILSYLQSSAKGAAKQCSGGDNGTACGTHWTKSEYDGKTGLGQELSALNVFLANLAVNSSAPTNANTTEPNTTGVKGTIPSSTSTATTSGKATATSSKSSSGSDRLWAASWTLSLVFPAVLLSLSLF
ncbi:MAG: hydrolase 76 protein [Alectoria sarmentosa]|nr:MAG: hydrolase 76 protein [Alectoria sarmentosa]